MPESILQTCIKISNEPPSDMKSNMRRAIGAFEPEIMDRLSTETKKTAFRWARGRGAQRVRGTVIGREGE